MSERPRMPLDWTRRFAEARERLEEAGAVGFRFGWECPCYLPGPDGLIDVPAEHRDCEQASWWARVSWRGRRVLFDDQPHPLAAVELLAAWVQFVLEGSRVGLPRYLP